MFKEKIENIKNVISDIWVEEPIDFSCPDISEEYYYTVFVSVSDGKSRAKVCHASAASFEEAYKKAGDLAYELLEKNMINPVWIKVDVVDFIQKIPYSKLKDIFLSAKYQKFFRMGFSLDSKMSMAFLETEANAYKIYDYTVIPMKASKPGHDKVPCINASQIEQYMRSYGKYILPDIGQFIYAFNCKSFFMDESGEIFRLYGSGMSCGRRIYDKLSSEFVESIIDSSSQHLIRQLQSDNQFVYGYYPSFDSALKSYSIQRHTGTLWAMMRAYDVTKDETLLGSVDRAIEYLLTQISYMDDNTAFVVEKKSNEIKLGGNAIAIISLTKYMQVFGNRDFFDIVCKLANGIIFLQDQTTGKLTHVINAKDFSVKEVFKSVSYDGESAYALIETYTISEDRKYLEAARLSIDYCIQNNYIRHRDYWISYAMNAFTKYVSEEKYYTFALRNAWENRERIRKQETSYHTYLELLMESYDLYLRMKREGIYLDYLDEIDDEEFEEIIHYRAWHMLDGYFYPEYAMYMSKPDAILGSFFVRHDEFRARIDDNQHFINGYVKYHQLLLAKGHERYKLSECLSSAKRNELTLQDIISAIAQNNMEYEELCKMCSGNLDSLPSIVCDTVSKMKPGCVVVWGNLLKDEHIEVVRKFNPLLIISEKQIADYPCYVCESSYKAWLRICHMKLQKYENLSKVVVTGSVGKTTVKDIIYSVMNAAGPAIKNEASVNGWRGIALAVSEATPELKYYVNEFGLQRPNSSFKVLSETIEPDVCVLTNIGDAHLENFKSKEHILEHKMKCADSMSVSEGVLVLNYDDPVIMGATYKHKYVTVSNTNAEADYYATDISMTDGINFVAVCKGRKVPIHLNIIGEHNIFNALVAVAVGDILGIKDDAIRQGISEYTTDGLRQNIVDTVSRKGTKQKLIVDCYNASSDSMRSSLKLLRGMDIPSGSKRIAVLGDMVSAGVLTEEVHREIGELARELGIDVVVGYGQHTRFSTDCLKGLENIVSAQFANEADIVKFLDSIISEGDVVLFKGSRVMKMENIITKLYDIELSH